MLIKLFATIWRMVDYVKVYGIIIIPDYFLSILFWMLYYNYKKKVKGP